MKVLTIFTVVFIPLNFIASIYGMNFSTDKSSWNMPELNWVYGYPFTLGLMAAVALSMLIYFRKKRWLGSMPYNGESQLDHPMRVQLDDRLEHKHQHD
jgi:magnesium transporter